MIQRKIGVWVVGITLCLMVKVQAVDELRTVLVVNDKSVDSLTIANHYAALRQLSSRCIIALPDVPATMQCSYEQFKTQILSPLLVNVDARGLARQADVIAYSADFPTAIDLTAPLSAKADLNRIFTKTGAINGLTQLYQLLNDEQLTFLAPRCNFYARPDLATLQQNPFFDEDRDTFDTIIKAQGIDELAAAIPQLRALINKHPLQWPLRYRLAQVQVAAGKNGDAFETISAMQRDRVAYRKWFDQDKQFDTVKDNSLYRKLLERMPNITPDRIPPIPFSSTVSWGQNGAALGNPAVTTPSKAPGPSYLLSTVLAVTQGRGTTLAEAIHILERAVGADGKGEKATFYFSDSSDVRSTTRSPLFKDAGAILRELGHEVVIDFDRLPVKRKRLMGAMLGSANYDWPAAGNQLLPGAIAENLTSTSGVLHQNNDQTSMVELLRGGAAGTSGTVTEPFALQFKFPTPYLFSYYAAGMSLVESFYLAVESPYQLLIVGDPLCRPYGFEQATNFEISAATFQEQSFRLQLAFADGVEMASNHVRQLDVYLDGLHIFSAKPIEDIQVNPLNLASGWHTLDVVAISNHPIRYPTRRSASFAVGPEERLPKLTLTTEAEGRMSVAVQCDQATQFAIEHLGRRVWESTDGTGITTLTATQTGYGPVLLRPLALVDNTWIAGKPQVQQVPLVDGNHSAGNQ